MYRKPDDERGMSRVRAAIAGTLLLLLCLSPTVFADAIAPKMKGAELRKHLRDTYSPRTSLDYKTARTHMFSRIDNRDGKVRLVYSGQLFETRGIPDHTKVNTEHTWPQSKFGNSRDKRKMKTDLHHLYPTFNRINAARGNSRFDEIPDERTEKWWRSPQSSREIPNEDIDAYSESTRDRFEPREDHKGNVARAMLYFFVIYEERGIDRAWFEPQIGTFKRWNQLDRVDEAERSRSRAIAKVQGNENPFVLDPTLADRIFDVEKPKEETPKAETSATTPQEKQRSEEGQQAGRFGDGDNLE